MHATATNFISARAETLARQAIRFPATAKVALAWLLRAHDWAARRGLKEILAETIVPCLVAVEFRMLKERNAADQGDPAQDFTFECPDGSKVCLPMWAGEGEV